MGLVGMWQGAVLALALVAVPVQARDLTKPAELPPSDYNGQQYVDSKGCLFMRAGVSGQTLWIPRVTRDGVPLCGNPPSGTRVPIAGEPGFDDKPTAVDSAAP